MLLTGVACNNEGVPDGPKGKYPILFRCSDDTRAVATVDSMKGDKKGFDVYAYIEGSTGATDSFEKNVKWDGSAWSYTDIEYWIPGATYWFKAVYPKDIATVVTNDTTQAVTITNFDITSQKDILVAETDRAGLKATPEDQAPTTGSVVSLQFKHLLANVTIKIKSQIDGVVVKNVTLNNIYDNAKYNGTKWEHPSNYTSVTYTSGVTLTKNADYKDVTGGGIMVIPGDNEGRSLRIEANKVYNVTIPPSTWEQGNRYTYTLLIKQDDIIFEDAAPYVEDWDSESATGSVIIK